MHANFEPNPICPRHHIECRSTPLRHQVVCPDIDCGYFERIEPLKLFNVITIWDVYVVAKDEEAAKEVVRQWAQSGELPPSSEAVLETRENRQIRGEWLDQKPLIGNDLSDEEFASLKGKTTLQAFERFYSKRGEVR